MRGKCTNNFVFQEECDNQETLEILLEKCHIPTPERTLCIAEFRQSNNQTFDDDYVTELKNLAKTGEFGNGSNHMT